MTAAEYIRHDLQARIASGQALPAELTLAGLSKHYGVSYTPVRVALRVLVAGRFVEKLGNGRYAVSDHPARDGRPRAIPQPVPPRHYDEVLAAEVIQRGLCGDGGYVREEVTAAKHGVGRTVIRQALHRLAGRGLVEHVPHRGWRVHAFSEQDMVDFLEIRETLELKALDLARGRLDRAVLEGFLAANTSDAAGRPRLDDRLHTHWIERSGNRYIGDFFTRHGPYFRALFNHAALTFAEVEAQAAAEHRDILRALFADDFDRARQALAAHIRGQQPKVARMFELLKRKDP